MYIFLSIFLSFKSCPQAYFLWSRAYFLSRGKFFGQKIDFLNTFWPPQRSALYPDNIRITSWPSTLNLAWFWCFARNSYADHARFSMDGHLVNNLNQSSNFFFSLQTWSDSLASEAQAWADNCGGPNHNRYGQNIATARPAGVPIIFKGFVFKLSIELSYVICHSEICK